MASEKQSIMEEMNHNQVTFVVPSNGDATRLGEFQEKIKETFGGRIIKTIGCVEQTLITYEGDNTITRADMLNKLVNMPQIERVEDNHSLNKRGNGHQGILVILAR